MIKRTGLLLIAASLCAGPAFADKAPLPPIQDPRIKRLVYSENTIYRLDLMLRSVTALQFSDSEDVQSILIGDSASWEVVKLKQGNVVSIKPTIQSAGTNLTIYTDRRVYTFELRSAGEFSPAVAGAGLLRTVFVYPDEKKPKPQAALLPAGRINSNYLVSGKSRFKPTWVQDDGRQTSFFIAPTAPRPAVFKVGPGRTEELINSRTRRDRIVVDGIADYWVLRIGDESVCIGKAEAVSANRRFFGLRIGHAR
jgi:type IV secretion system protein VirB9